MALLHILHRMSRDLHFTLDAVTINHHLRPESKRECEFVREECDRMGVPIRVLHPEVRFSGKGSMEAWARAARHKLLETHAREKGVDRVALGHHQDDQVETFFTRLLRGTGARGLGGMDPLWNHLYIRPLLCVNKKEIFHYLKENNISWVEDPSNRDLRFLRNRIRHRLLRSMDRLFSPLIRKRILSAQNLLRRDESYLSSEAAAWLATNAGRKNGVRTLPRTSWEALHPALRLRVILGFVGLSVGHPPVLPLKKLLSIENDLMKGKNIPHTLSPYPFLLSLECDTIVLVPVQPQLSEPVELKVPGVTEVPELRVSVRVECTEKIPATLWECRIRHGNQPLTVVTRRGGEFVQEGKKLVSVKKLLKEAKLPRHVKRHIPLIREGETVVWIPGVYSADPSGEGNTFLLRWQPWKKS